ncbi:hypothetical protein B0O99DRAFT_724338 [Bisporella sp. PMI_857]|nr:hypothetical protein B0O99DRAFT_724338 [Bisporella sp. PMI_857]
MGCGLTNCYSTEVVTLTMAEALVTTEDGQLATMTNTIVTTVFPDKPTAVLSSKQSGVLPKETAPVESAIAKTKPSRASSSGLSKAQIGGIIAAAVVLLVILLIISFFIMKRLNNVKRIVEEHSRKSSSTPRSRQTRQQISTPTTDIYAMSIDPLIMSSSEVARSAQNPSHPSAVHSSHYEVEASSPPAFQSPFLLDLLHPTANGNGYAPVAMSDTSSTHRNASVDSTPGIFQSPTDISTSLSQNCVIRIFVSVTAQVDGQVDTNDNGVRVNRAR